MRFTSPLLATFLILELNVLFGSCARLSSEISIESRQGVQKLDVEREEESGEEVEEADDVEDPEDGDESLQNKEEFPAGPNVGEDPEDEQEDLENLEEAEDEEDPEDEQSPGDDVLNEKAQDPAGEATTAATPAQAKPRKDKKTKSKASRKAKTSRKGTASGKSKASSKGKSSRAGKASEKDRSKAVCCKCSEKASNDEVVYSCSVAGTCRGCKKYGGQAKAETMPARGACRKGTKGQHTACRNTFEWE